MFKSELISKLCSCNYSISPEVLLQHGYCVDYLGRTKNSAILNNFCEAREVMQGEAGKFGIQASPLHDLLIIISIILSII